MPFDLSEVLNDPDMTQQFTVMRPTGQFGPGGWQVTTTSKMMMGIVYPASAEELQAVPEGDRIAETMTFLSSQEIMTTHNDAGGGGGTSDEIVWRGDTYRVLKVLRYVDYGYYMAFAQRIKGS